MIPRLGELKHGTLNPRQTRISGVVLIILGLFLIGFASLVVAIFLDLIALSTILPGVYRDPNAEPRSTPVAAWVVFLYIVLFGLISVVEGIWQVRFGLRNKYLTGALIFLALLLAAAGIVAEGLS